MTTTKRAIGGDSDRSYVKFSECTKGDLLVNAIYRDSYEGQYGINYVFENDDSSETVLPGSGQLNYLMKKVSPGMRLEIHFNGQEEITKGPFAGKMANAFLISEIMAEDIDVAAIIDAEENV